MTAADPLTPQPRGPRVILASQYISPPRHEARERRRLAREHRYQRTARPDYKPTGTLTRSGGLGGGLIEYLATSGSGSSAPARGDITGQTNPFQSGQPFLFGPRNYRAPEPLFPGRALTREDPSHYQRPELMRPDRVDDPFLPFFTRRDERDPNYEAPRRAFDIRYHRQVVDYPTNEKPGSVVIDTRARFLYYVQDNGKAIRYGVGVGRPGFEWRGIKQVSAKKEWPDWRPPDEMLKRRPDLPVWMAGGLDNPLGARAIYLGSSLYRIHGSNEPGTIGQAVSSGCFRMKNEDVIDLYDRVKVGTKVVVI
jgi:lipoprotein-anchoring transpeptidase ErfK/SrfK